MMKKPILGIIGVSDGEPEVHEQLKDFVQARVDEIVAALRESGEVEIIEAKELVCDNKSAKEQAEYLRNQGVDGTIISHAVFAFPSFSAIIANNETSIFIS